MPQQRKITIKGKQREDVDAQAMARVIILLARSWLEQQESPHDGREHPITGTAQIVERPRGEEQS